jgi:hypothetical protein
LAWISFHEANAVLWQVIVVDRNVDIVLKQLIKGAKEEALRLSSRTFQDKIKAVAMKVCEHMGGTYDDGATMYQVWLGESEYLKKSRE